MGGPGSPPRSRVKSLRFAPEIRRIFAHERPPNAGRISVTATDRPKPARGIPTGTFADSELIAFLHQRGTNVKAKVTSGPPRGNSAAWLQLSWLSLPMPEAHR